MIVMTASRESVYGQLAALRVGSSACVPSTVGARGQTVSKTDRPGPSSRSASGRRQRDVVRAAGAGAPRGPREDRIRTRAGRARRAFRVASFGLGWRFLAWKNRAEPALALGSGGGGLLGLAVPLSPPHRGAFFMALKNADFSCALSGA